MLPFIELSLKSDEEKLLNVARALSSPQRLDILKVLHGKSMNIKELASFLKQPISSTSLNIDILHKCDLIQVEDKYNSLGRFKLCSRNCDGVKITLFEGNDIKTKQIQFEIPVGSYSDYNIKPTCGLVTKEHTIGQENDEDNFFDPKRYEAELLWFSSGYVEYRISRKKLPKKLKSLEINFEACSEAPFYRNDWKSDITVWINNVEIGTWTCPGDFGGRRGKNNPAWWSQNNTQYGILTNWTIDENCTYLNNSQISSCCLANIGLDRCQYVSFKIGVKENAHYCGGINLFGKSYGDYAQDIIVTASW